MRRTCALLIALATTATANAGPFTNGSFETAPTTAEGYTPLLGGSTLIPGWTVTGHSVDWILTFWNPSDGISSLDLSGGLAGGVFQTFDTTPGQVYTVTFDMAGNPDDGPATKQLSVSTDGVNFTPYTFTITSASTGASPYNPPFNNMLWEQRIYNFTATGTSTTLTFRSDVNTAFGPALDNVSVSAAAIPEPATLAVIGGLALAGLAGFRRRKAG